MLIENAKADLSRAVEKLNDLQQQLTAFFTTLPDPIFILNSQGEYIEVLGGNNQNLYETGQHLKGRFLKDVFEKELVASFLEAINRALASGGMVTIEYQLKFDTSQPIPFLTEGDWFEGRIMAVKGESEETTDVVLWTAINITEKKQLENQLRDLAEKDILTGLYNRRVMTERLREAYAYYQRYGTPFAVIFADLDRFKLINDTYGHDAGDAVIRAFSRLISDHLRVNDVASRYGGEEFLILLPDSDKEGAFSFAEALRNKTEQQRVPIADKEIEFTASIGIAIVSNADESYGTIVSRADAALYQAKNTGRNKTCLA